MSTSQTYVVKVTQLEPHAAFAKIRATCPLDAAGKAARMVHFGDPRLEFEPEYSNRIRHEVGVQVFEKEPRIPAKETTRCSRTMYTEPSPTERRLKPDPLTMFEMLVEFVATYREGLGGDAVDPTIDPDGWLNCLFEDLRLVDMIDHYGTLIAMKLRTMPAHKAMAASRPTKQPRQDAEIVDFPAEKKAKRVRRSKLIGEQLSSEPMRQVGAFASSRNIKSPKVRIDYEQE